MACQHDYHSFYEREMRMRRVLRFPPVERLISILASGGDSGAVASLANRLGGMLRSLGRSAAFESVAVLGPAPCPIERIRGKWRWRILLRGNSSAAMHNLLRAGLKEFDRVNGRGSIAIQIDVDPQDML
jgi:primosomal protein N' (replication factor Y)